MSTPAYLPTPSPQLIHRNKRLLAHMTLSLGLGIGLLGLLPHPVRAQTPQLDLPRLRLQAGMHLIDAQVAQTPPQRNTGLMWRQDMAANEGMLFVFEAPATQCFWMKNTLLPLTAAFVADDGTVVNLANMQPRSEANHCSSQPVRYVLEMHQGWFDKHGVQAGYKLRGSVFRAP